MRKNALVFCFIAGFIVLSNSCRKSDRENDTETQSATDGSTAQYYYADMFTQLYKAAAKQKDLYTTPVSDSLACATVSIYPAPPVTGFPKTLTIDYGSGCTDGNGINRKGKILASFTGKLSGANTVITISFDGYKINGASMEGTYKITCLGKNTSNRTYYAVNTSNFAITNSSGKTYWTTSHRQEWLSGDTTSVLSDDSFLITGTGSGTGTRGTTFKTEITSALKFAYSCPYITSGKFTLSPGALAIRTIDFGSSCDNTVEINFNGESHTTTIK